MYSFIKGQKSVEKSNMLLIAMVLFLIWKGSTLLNRVLENLCIVLLPGSYILRDKAKVFPFNVIKYLIKYFIQLIFYNLIHIFWLQVFNRAIKSLFPLLFYSPPARSEWELLQIIKPSFINASHQATQCSRIAHRNRPEPQQQRLISIAYH